MLKAAAGGGGKGIRIVEQPSRISKKQTASRAPRPSLRSATVACIWRSSSPIRGTSRSR